MMIANRESFAAASRRRLPYDAEVQYLGLGGAQFIDTGIVASGALVIETDFMLTQILGNTIVSGVRSSDQFLHVPQIPSSGSNFSFSWLRGIVPARNGQPASLNVRHTIRAELRSGYQSCVINGYVNSAGTTTGALSAGLTIYVGKRHFHSASDSVYGLVGRLYGYRLYKDGDLVRDLHPVRYNGVGYMYDSVTNTLLANAGTGSFTVGPDIN